MEEAAKMNFRRLLREVALREAGVDCEKSQARRFPQID